MKGIPITIERNGRFITGKISHYKKLLDGVYDFVLHRDINDDLFLDDNTTLENGVEHQRAQRQHRYPVREGHAIHSYG